MQTFSYTREQLVNAAKFSNRDLEAIKRCRRDYNRLGFGYQLACVHVLNRLPTGHPLEVIDDILAYVSAQLNIPNQDISFYAKWQKTVFEHQERIKWYLGLHPFRAMITEVNAFLLKEAYQLEQSVALMSSLRAFLKTHRTLEPSHDTMARVVQTQREAARIAIYGKVSAALGDKMRASLDALLSTEHATYSPLYYLKQPPGNPSPASFIKLTEILEKIKETAILTVDLTWLNNNFQRSLARYARQCTIYRLRRLKEEKRYTVLICFLRQCYRDTFDAAVQMHDKLMNKIYNKADREIDSFMKARRKHIRASLIHYRAILDILLDEAIDQLELKDTIFQTVNEETLKVEKDEIDGLFI